MSKKIMYKKLLNKEILNQIVNDETISFPCTHGRVRGEFFSKINLFTDVLHLNKINISNIINDVIYILKGNPKMKKSAFTLAEVLITLGIIGVVAALTLPTLIANYHRKHMEVLFKKVYSTLQQAIYGIDMNDYSGLSSNAGNTSTDYYNDLYSKFKIVQSTKVPDMYYKTINNKKTLNIKTYTGETAIMNQCVQLPTRRVSDGFAFGGMYNCFANWIIIDTNGAKQPNRYGHDIFVFGLNETKKIIPLGKETYHWEMNGKATYCSKNSTNTQNGTACSYFAVANICPDDTSKTYWECLPK